jgi:hypothetical protein
MKSPSNLCKFREEMLLQKDKNFRSDNISYIKIDKNLIMPNPESTEDAE